MRDFVQAREDHINKATEWNDFCSLLRKDCEEYLQIEQKQGCNLSLRVLLDLCVRLSNAEKRGKKR